MYYRQCGDLPIHPFRSNANNASREYWMSMLMLTEGDARYAAAYLNMQDDGYVYLADPNFMGYEGPDWGVCRYVKKRHAYAGPFHSPVCRNHLAHICWDRPIVPQSDAFNRREI